MVRVINVAYSHVTSDYFYVPYIGKIALGVQRIFYPMAETSLPRDLH